MTTNWCSSKKAADRLRLECPACGNDAIFEGTDYQGYLIWKCAVCGDYLSLNLKEIQPTFI